VTFAALFPAPPLLGLHPADYPPDPQSFFWEPDVFDDMMQATHLTVIIEVGTWKGHSAIHMASYSGASVVCVDTWLGSLEHWVTPCWHADLHIQHGRPTLWDRFVGNVLAAGVADHVYPLPLPSSTAAQVLRHHGIRADLIYIDGSHETQDVMADLEAYHGLLTPAGLMFGDDWHAPSVRIAVRLFANRRDLTVLSKGGKWVLTREPGRLGKGFGVER
jgi:hypothetical protein